MGLPGFQFIQDRLDYSSRLWHSHVDTLDHASEDDLRQAATILAGFLYQAATMDELVPRKPMPKEPSKAEQEKAKRKGEKALRDKQRKALEDQDRIAFRYDDGQNPNGSTDDIAGVLNPGRNVLGLMPHPENATDPLSGGEDGLALFTSLLEAA